jgi:hypothetical protein
MSGSWKEESKAKAEAKEDNTVFHTPDIKLGTGTSYKVTIRNLARPGFFLMGAGMKTQTEVTFTATDFFVRKSIVPAYAQPTTGTRLVNNCNYLSTLFSKNHLL